MLGIPIRRFAPASVMAAWQGIIACRQRFGRYPAIIFPRTFNEKVLFRKIFDRRAIFSVFADKYDAREHVKKTAGERYLSKVFYIGDQPSGLPFDEFPNRYVIKPTHGSGWLRIVTDAATLDRAEMVEQCRKWLKRNYFYAYWEWQYKRLKPRIMVEEYLDDGTGKPPMDYKFFVFDGRVELVQVDFGRFEDHRQNLYDRNWSLIDVKYVAERGPRHWPMPANLPEMICVAESIAAGYDFLRVDLYDLKHRIVFGEITVTPNNGTEPFEPDRYDFEIGALWRLRRPFFLPSAQRTAS